MDRAIHDMNTEILSGTDVTIIQELLTGKMIFETGTVMTT